MKNQREIRSQQKQLRTESQQPLNQALRNIDSEVMYDESNFILCITARLRFKNEWLFEYFFRLLLCCLLYLQNDSVCEDYDRHPHDLNHTIVQLHQVHNLTSSSHSQFIDSIQIK